MSTINKIAIAGIAALALGFSSNASASLSSITTQNEIHQNASVSLIEIYQPLGLENLVQSEQNNMIYRVGVPGVVKNDRKPDKVVYLSFDDGYGDIWQILNMLNSLPYNVHATFCLLGAVMEKQPDFVRAAVASGHRICNHTYNHHNLSLLSDAEIAKQLNYTDYIYDSIINPETPGDTTKPWMRAPGGTHDQRVIATVNNLGYYIEGWNVSSIDTEPSFDANTIIGNVLPKVQNGSIILFHFSNPADLQAVPIIVQSLHNQGYEFATFDRMLGK